MKTMKQRLLALLLKQWVTPLDALNKVGCMSLSQRCGEFSAHRKAYEEYADLSAYFTTKPGRDAWPPRIISKWVTLPNGKRCKAYKAIK